ncbi:MAG: stage III sporulation protein AC [Vulcanibacillus sp.]
MEFEASTIFQIAGMGIILAMIHTILKQVGKEDIAHWVVVSGFVIILYMVASFVGDLFEEMQRIFLFK